MYFFIAYSNYKIKHETFSLNIFFENISIDLESKWKNKLYCEKFGIWGYPISNQNWKLKILYHLIKHTRLTCQNV